MFAQFLRDIIHVYIQLTGKTDELSSGQNSNTYMFDIFACPNSQTSGCKGGRCHFHRPNQSVCQAPFSNVGLS